MAERLRFRARTSGALRWRGVTPAATSCWASKSTDAPAVPIRPPPAASARGSSASGLLKRSGLESAEGTVQPLRDLLELLAGRRDVRHCRRLRLDDGADLLSHGRIRLDRRSYRFDLLR